MNDINNKNTYIVMDGGVLREGVVLLCDKYWRDVSRKVKPIETTKEPLKNKGKIEKEK